MSEPKQLRADLQSVLDKFDLQYEPSLWDNPSFRVLTCDGDVLFVVSDAISAADLHSIITYGQRMWREGAEQGAAAARYKMRAALGFDGSAGLLPS